MGAPFVVVRTNACAGGTTAAAATPTASAKLRATPVRLLICLSSPFDVEPDGRQNDAEADLARGPHVDPSLQGGDLPIEGGVSKLEVEIEGGPIEHHATVDPQVELPKHR